jgi:hypothetical protein
MHLIVYLIMLAFYTESLPLELVLRDGFDLLLHFLRLVESLLVAFQAFIAIVG